MSASVPVSVVFDQVREIARLRGEVERWRSLFEAARAQAEGREASRTDLPNSWARESGVQEAEGPEGAQALVDQRQ